MLQLSTDKGLGVSDTLGVRRVIWPCVVITQAADCTKGCTERRTALEDNNACAVTQNLRSFTHESACRSLSVFPGMLRINTVQQQCITTYWWISPEYDPLGTYYAEHTKPWRVNRQGFIAIGFVGFYLRAYILRAAIRWTQAWWW